jgi:hypothetical protein
VNLSAQTVAGNLVCDVKLRPEELLRRLYRKAEAAMKKPLMLMHGDVYLRAEQSAAATRLRDGDLVTAVAVLPRLFSNPGAYAAIKADGSVICWGDSDKGGNCNTVKQQLVEVDQI